MLTITVPTKIPYDVQIGGGLLDGVGTKIRALTKAVRVMLVSDDIVAPLYGARVRASLEGVGFAVSEFVFANGEAQKRLSTLELRRRKHSFPSSFRKFFRESFQVSFSRSRSLWTITSSPLTQNPILLKPSARIFTD